MIATVTTAVTVRTVTITTTTPATHPAMTGGGVEPEEGPVFTGPQFTADRSSNCYILYFTTVPRVPACIPSTLTMGEALTLLLPVVLSSVAKLL